MVAIQQDRTKLRRNEQRQYLGSRSMDVFVRLTIGVVVMIVIVVNKYCSSVSSSLIRSVNVKENSNGKNTIAAAHYESESESESQYSTASSLSNARSNDNDDGTSEINVQVSSESNDDYDNSYDNWKDDGELKDLHATAIRSRIVEEFGALFDRAIDDSRDADIDSDGRYDRLWSIYDRGGSYYDLLGDHRTPQGKAFRWIVDDARNAITADLSNDDAHEGENENENDNSNSNSNSGAALSGEIFSYASSFLRGSAATVSNADGADNPTLVQRYVLAVLHFSTTETTHDDDDDDTPTPSQQWTSSGSLNFLSPGRHECTWNLRQRGTAYGVKCCTPVTALDSALDRLTASASAAAGGAGGQNRCRDNAVWDVTELFLPELEMAGSLPEEIGFLTGLRVLDVQNNRFTGTVPQSLGFLTNLHYLGLGSNQFTGTIPDTMKSLTLLDTLYLNFNKMDGGDYLSTSICDLKNSPTKHLYSLWADCNRKDDPLQCDCCDVCCDSMQCRPPVTRGTQRVGEGDDGGDGDGNGDGKGDSKRILSRNKRSIQKKEESEHRSEEWFPRAWGYLNNRR